MFTGAMLDASGDHWEVICSQGGNYWRRQVPVRLRGLDTGKYLATNSRHQYGCVQVATTRLLYARPAMAFGEALLLSNESVC